MTTGYYANEKGNVSRIHVVRSGWPICRYRPAESMRLRCVEGIKLSAVTCPKCRKRAERFAAALLEALP